MLIRFAPAFAGFLCLVLAAPGTTLAAVGDCGQPRSTGSQVRSSDALAILRAAVALEDCGICVCDVDGSGAIRASDALSTLKVAVGVTGISLTCSQCDGPGVSGTVFGIGGTLDDAGRSRGVDQGEPFAGLTPVPGALVELHEIDDSGESLALLDLEPTDEAGRFSFRASTGLGTHLELRAFDSNGERVFSALATGTEADIDPASEFVLSIVLRRSTGRGAAGGSLTNFTAGEYNGCVGQARAVTPENAPADARGFVELIAAATGGFLAEQITAFALSPDLTAGLSGDYWALSSDMFFEASTTPGEIDATPDLNNRCIFISSGTNTASFDGSGGFSRGDCSVPAVAMCKTSGTQRFSSMGDVKVNATIDIFSETGTCETETGGTYDLAGDGTVLIVDPEGSILPTVATADGAWLAVGLFEDEGDSFARGFAIAFPQADSASDATFDGEYHFVQTEGVVRSEMFESFIVRTTSFSSGPGTASADGNGGVDLDFNSGKALILSEAAPPASAAPADPNVTLDVETTDNEPADAFTYDVAGDGALTLRQDGSLIARGAISPDGSVANISGVFDEGNEAGVTNVVMVKRSSGLSATDLAGAWHLVGQLVENEVEFTPGSFDGPLDSNFRATCMANVLGTLELGSDNTFSLPSFVIDDVCLDETSFVERSSNNPGGRVFDANVNFFRITEAESGLGGTWSVTSDGRVTIDAGVIELEGAATSDGGFFIAEGVVSEGDAASRLVLMGVRMPPLL